MLCHILVEQVPADALPELFRSIQEIDAYYSRPIDVTPTQTIRVVTAKAGSRHAPPRLDLAEA